MNAARRPPSSSPSARTAAGAVPAAQSAPDPTPASWPEQHALQTLAEKGFIHDAAHQLRTPLAGIISQAELALQENNPQQLHQRIRKIHAAASRGAQLVKQMLALARSEASAPDCSASETYDLAQLAREVAREWIPKSLALHKDLGYEGADSAWVRGNRFMMREAISNLIDNALNYTAANGHITVRIQLSAMPQGAAPHSAETTPVPHTAPATGARNTHAADRLNGNKGDDECPGTPSPHMGHAGGVHAVHASHAIVLEVADNGPGVAPEQLPHVFERFWRADDEHTSGSGLGLPLVERIAAQHGGHASAHNALPHGFIVRLHLPAAAPADTDQ